MIAPLRPLEKVFEQLRPNTAFPDDMLHKDQIWCFGEPYAALAQAVQGATGRIVLQSETRYENRGFSAWSLPKSNGQGRFTLLLCPLGSGSVEPVFYETMIANPNVAAERIVLIGTAGVIQRDFAYTEQALQSSAGTLGGISIIGESYPVGFGISCPPSELPLHPRIITMKVPDRVGVVEGVSTDYFYACSPPSTQPFMAAMQEGDPSLLAGLLAYYKSGRRADMETFALYRLGQLYNRVKRTQGGSRIEYAAVRADANFVGQWEGQSQYTNDGLTEACRAALEMLAV